MEPPSRYFLKTLSAFVDDEKRAEKLREFASKSSVSLLEMNFLGGEIRVLQVLCQREAHCA